jgi:cAMP-dependent protein kinase regulator
MYNTSRAATCIATSDVKLWALDRASFKGILTTTSNSKRNLHKAFLMQVPILSSLDETEILHAADALVEEEYKEGEEVCKQGETGTKFYIVKKARMSHHAIRSADTFTGRSALHEDGRQWTASKCR